MTVNTAAPVRGWGDLKVDADAATVWSVMSEIADWPSWSKDISAARLLGPLAPGSKFEWQAGPGKIRSTLLAVEPGHKLAWTGTTMGVRAIHVWRIERRGDQTYVVTEESWEGLLASLLRRSMRRRLQAAIDEGLPYLKAEAERRYRAREQSR